PCFLLVRGMICVPEAIRHRGHRGHRVCWDRIGSPTPPMPPMPYAIGSVVRRLVKRIARRSPFPAGFLAHQNKTGGTGSRDLPESGRNELTPSTQRIDETLHRLGQLRCPTGSDPMMLPPGLEQLGDVLAIRVVRFQHFEPLDGISTTK